MCYIPEQNQNVRIQIAENHIEDIHVNWRSHEDFTKHVTGVKVHEIVNSLSNVNCCE